MSSRARVYITRQIPQNGLDLLLGRCNVSFWDSADPAPRTELLRNVRGVAVLLCMPTDIIDLEVLNTAGPNLKIVATMSEDSDHIDREECERRKIQIVTMQKVSTDTVADLTVALIAVTTRDLMDEETGNLNTLLQAKNIVESIKNDKKYCVELSNRTIGIVGLGPLGLSVGRTLTNICGMSILYTDVGPVAMADEISAEYVSRDELLEKSDIICVCSNVQGKGTSTAPVFNKSAFKKMKSSAILIDATKGFMADFSDLYDALKDGNIAAAGLDVREYDVIPNRHPLAVLENCFFLPYRECYKWDGRRRLSVALAKSILETM